VSPVNKHLDRNWQELLQELRVAQTGVQILTGFLLTLPFTPRFQDIPGESRFVYGVVLSAAISATFLLMTPVALHRALFHRGERPWLVDAADTAARYGLATLALANLGAMWLILDVISSRVLASVAVGVLSVAILWLWVLLPRQERERTSSKGDGRNEG